MARLTSRRPPRIVLTGFSGSGKSQVAPVVAQKLGWRVIDTDKRVEQAAGKPIPDIFRDEGEERFRQLESEAIREACQQERAVISVGGGAILRAENRRLMAQGGFIVCLEARPEAILQRLRENAVEDLLDRPLLAGPDPLARVQELKGQRQPFYALADWTVHSDSLTPEEVAQEVVRAWRRHAARVLADPHRLKAITAGPSVTEAAPPYSPPSQVACVVRTAGGGYPVYVSWNALFDLGGRMRQAGLGGGAFIISDDMVFPRYGKQVEHALRQADFAVAAYSVPAGEGSKTLTMAARLYDWLIEQRAERGQAVIALGGGMITDLAGFVAATFARGLPLVHVPTSLLAMVDAAIGGKVAVNLPQAKNLVGAFYQPRLVLADVASLKSLPPRELASGWAEVIKHAMIADENLLALLEEKAEAIRQLEPEVATEVIRRSIAIKAAVVSEDEREETGRRMVLNYGHTVAHALEAASAYAGLLHGEAVAVGMTAAAQISRRLGLLPAQVAQRQRRLLERFGLPTSRSGIDRARVRQAMALDKKVRAGAIRWVLLEGIGRPVLRDDVPADIVEEALAKVLS